MEFTPHPRESILKDKGVRQMRPGRGRGLSQVGVIRKQSENRKLGQ